MFSLLMKIATCERDIHPALRPQVLAWCRSEVEWNNIFKKTVLLGTISRNQAHHQTKRAEVCFLGMLTVKNSSLDAPPRHFFSKCSPLEVKKLTSCACPFYLDPRIFQAEVSSSQRFLSGLYRTRTSFKKPEGSLRSKTIKSLGSKGSSMAFRSITSAFANTEESLKPEPLQLIAEFCGVRFGK
jgi:hypothetical protein